MKTKNPEVAIIMGSDSDLPVMKDAAQILDDFGVNYQQTVISAHRTPDKMASFAKSARNQGFKVIIAGAGGAAHLPGMTAAYTSLPTIGVPIGSANPTVSMESEKPEIGTVSVKGLDSLVSVAQMPPGIPVGTMAINGAKNAGLLAVEILSISDKSLAEKLDSYRKTMKNDVEEKAEKLEKMGYKKYLKQK